MQTVLPALAPKALLPLDELLRTRVLAAVGLTETPFFGIDIAGVRTAFLGLRRAWASHFPRIEVAFSYKTNPLAAVTRELLGAGASAEVVSGTELGWALADGASPQHILFDGPVKCESELARALELGVELQIDSLEEAELVARMLARRPSSARFRLRLATPRSAESWSRFGLFGDEIWQATLRLEQAGAKVSGLHLHSGSNLGVERHALSLAVYTDVLRWFQGHAGGDFSLDIGGGYAASTAGATPPPPECYAENVARALQGIGIDPSGLRLVIEPGRCLVEDAGVLVTRVQSCKRRGDRGLVVCDAGTHLLRSASSWRHEIYSVASSPAPAEQHFTLFGANAFESDVLGADVVASLLPAAGELLVIGACGGYDIASSSGWTRPRPPVIGWDGARLFVAREPQSDAALRGCPDTAASSSRREHSLSRRDLAAAGEPS